MAFNPSEHMMQLQKKDYLEVKWRLVWFREACPQGTIDTEELAYDLDRECEAELSVWNKEKNRSEKVLKKARGYARYRAVVTDGKGGRATGTKSENAASFGDFGEKAESGAVGRALAMLGYGTQFAMELEEGERIVDSPVENNGHHTAPPRQLGTAKAPPQEAHASRDTLNELYAYGKRIELYTDLAGFGKEVTKALGVDAPVNPQKLTEKQVAGIRDIWHIYELQSASEQAQKAS